MKNGQRPQYRHRGLGYNPDLARYESLKAAWQASNPQATHEQYQDAMRKLAQECGI